MPEVRAAIKDMRIRFAWGIEKLWKTLLRVGYRISPVSAGCLVKELLANGEIEPIRFRKDPCAQAQQEAPLRQARDHRQRPVGTELASPSVDDDREVEVAGEVKDYEIFFSIIKKDKQTLRIKVVGAYVRDPDCDRTKPAHALRGSDCLLGKVLFYRILRDQPRQ